MTVGKPRRSRRKLNAGLEVLRVDQVRELIALYEASRAEYHAIEQRLFGGPQQDPEGGNLRVFTWADLEEHGRRDKLIAAYGNPARRAYRDALYALSDEAIGELIALAWLGRGDHYDFAALVRDQRGFQSREANLGYIKGKSAMPRRYWAAGLAMLEAPHRRRPRAGAERAARRRPH